MAAAPIPPRADAARLHPLDGLRGIAAVAVVLSHVIMWIEMPVELRSLIDVSPLGPLVNGPGAVHVFFVLSGYVLALTLKRDVRPGHLLRYYVRRLFRIQPPYMAAVLFAWLVTQIVIPRAPHDAEPPWALVPGPVLPVALAFPSMAFGLLPVGWSLYVEMAMSAVFPLLFLLGRRIHPLLPVGLSLVLLPVGRPWTFLRFSIDFTAGLALSLEAQRIAAAMRRLPAIAPALLGGIGLAVFQLPYYAGLAATGYAGIENGHSPDVILQFTIASVLMVLAALHSPATARVLASGPGRFLGRISYSLYLVHQTLILAFVTLHGGQAFSWPLGVAVGLISLVLSIALSEVGWRAVEEPAIRAGRAVIRAGEALAQRVSGLA